MFPPWPTRHLCRYIGSEVSLYKDKRDKGEKKIDTKLRYISNGKAQFNERFSMKTVLNYDE